MGSRCGSDYALATDLQVADAINWAWQYAHADVINNSWQLPSASNAVDQAISNAVTQGRAGLGTVVVQAAGNCGSRDNNIICGVSEPATYAQFSALISVGAIDKNGNIADYSPRASIGNEIDLVAPSSAFTGGPVCGPQYDILTIDRRGSPGCNNTAFGQDFAYFGGTSAAAAQVSGVATLLLSARAYLTASQVKQRLRSAADNWGAAYDFGAGKVNAGRALALP